MKKWGPQAILALIMLVFVIGISSLYFMDEDAFSAISDFVENVVAGNDQGDVDMGIVGGDVNIDGDVNINTGESEDPNRHVVKVTLDPNGGKVSNNVINVIYKQKYGILPEPTREGMEFLGWYINDKTRINSESEVSTYNDHTLTAKWGVNVSFDVGYGIEVDSQTIAYNTTATKPQNPILNGYTFDGWFLDEEYTEPFDFKTAVISNITLYAKWTRIEFTVTFITNGGTSVDNAIISIADGYKITEPTTTKQYYILDGWYEDDGLTQKYDFDSEITSNITLYAKWIPVKSVVSFVDTDGKSEIYDEFGTIIVAQTTDIEKDFKIIVPTPYKEGYTFIEWHLDGIPVDLSSGFKPREEEYVLVSKWKVNQYTINFDTDGGSPIEPITENYGTRIVAPSDPTKTGYTFAGWDKVIPDTMPAKNMMITAKWKINQHTIIFDTDGGSAIGPITENYGTRIVAPSDPTKTGYTFAGWDKVIPETMPDSDITITARWTINNYKVIYYVDGAEYATQTYNYGDSLNLVAEPESPKGEKEFSGWYCITMADIPKTMPDSDFSIFGTYDIKEHTITYIVDGKVYYTQKAKTGTPVITPENPTKIGHTFKGWDKPVPETMSAENITITSRGWDINQYTITYIVDGSVYYTQKANYMDPVIAPENPTKTGHTFKGWDNPIPETMPAENVTITGKGWDINQYTITYIVDGNVYYTETANYGDQVITPENPTKIGHTFKGWDKPVPETMPAENVTITGKGWEIIQYTVEYIVDDVTVDNQNVIGEVEISNLVSGVDVRKLTYYEIAQLNIAKSQKYSEYYNFVGWFTEDGVRLTDGDGNLLENVANYISDGRWIYEGTGESKQSITLYGRLEQTDSGKYIHNAESLTHIKNDLFGTYVIIDDIDLTGVNWIPFDTFYGKIDGKDHTISNISININEDMAENRAYGFVNNLGGKIENLIICDANYIVSTVNSTSVKDTRYTILGTFAGEILDMGEINNCQARNPKLSCDAYSYYGDCQWKFVFVGGIAGYSAGSINNCTVSSGKLYGWGAVKFVGQFVEVAVGGVVGYLKAGVVTNCKVKDVTIESKGCSWGELLNRAYDAYSNAGGLAGLMKESDVTDYQTGNVVTGGSRDAIVDIAYSASKGYTREGEYIASTEIKNHNNK